MMLTMNCPLSLPKGRRSFDLLQADSQTCPPPSASDSTSKPTWRLASLSSGFVLPEPMPNIKDSSNLMAILDGGM